eukprot:scaffold2049_cov108-Cylindrotheca_fusiformis.AAC.6
MPISTKQKNKKKNGKRKTKKAAKQQKSDPAAKATTAAKKTPAEAAAACEQVASRNHMLSSTVATAAATTTTIATTTNTAYCCQHSCNAYKEQQQEDAVVFDFVKRLLELFREELAPLGSVAAQKLCDDMLFPLKDGLDRAILLDKIRSVLLAVGTQHILEEGEGVFHITRLYAQAVAHLESNYFDEEYRDQHKKNKDQWALMKDLLDRGDLVITAFYAKRIPCSCLDQKYASLKAQPRMKRCFHCDKQKARSELMFCTGCSLANYCSRDCQRADWKIQHKYYCSFFRISVCTAKQAIASTRK